MPCALFPTRGNFLNAIGVNILECVYHKHGNNKSRNVGMTMNLMIYFNRAKIFIGKLFSYKLI